mmetsp:Transcript_15638/g.53033  ORF Transcript_15638/g.53033 Transcript_15638/m.53033 type:complete len:254 (+) Transcript_15638:239-1000(+)
MEPAARRGEPRQVLSHHRALNSFGARTGCQPSTPPRPSPTVAAEAVFQTVVALAPAVQLRAPQPTMAMRRSLSRMSVESSTAHASPEGRMRLRPITPGVPKPASTWEHSAGSGLLPNWKIFMPAGAVLSATNTRRAPLPAPPEPPAVPAVPSLRSLITRRTRSGSAQMNEVFESAPTTVRWTAGICCIHVPRPAWSTVTLETCRRPRARAREARQPSRLPPPAARAPGRAAPSASPCPWCESSTGSSRGCGPA